MNTSELKRLGYKCTYETISGQGYFGGDGVNCYRVRDKNGNLVNYKVSTHQTARAAWDEAKRILERSIKSNPRKRKSASSRKNPSTREHRSPIYEKYKYAVQYSEDKQKWIHYGAFTQREIADDIVKALACRYPHLYIRVQEK